MIGALAGIAMADAGLLAMADAVPPGVLVTAHVGATLAALALWLHAGRIAALPAILAPIGPAALLAGIALSRWLPARAAPARAGEDAPPVRARPTAARLLDGRVRHAAPDALGSLVAVMRHGDVATRRRALETVVRSFEPALSPLVALALTDDDQTIRALAAAASARVAANFAATRARLEADAATGDAGATTALAAFLSDHARANVLFSDTQRATMRQDALALAVDDRALAAAGAWAAGDYEALDRLVATPATGPGDALAPLRGWWRAEPA